MYHARGRLSVRGQLVLSLVSLLLGAPMLRAAEFTEKLTLTAEELFLVNLMGQVEVEHSDGEHFEIEIAVLGRDASYENIQVHSEGDRKAKVVVAYPVDRAARFVYPPLGRGNQTIITLQGGQGQEGHWLQKLLNSLSQKKVTIAGSGSGLEVWADVTVKVPAERRLVVWQGVGDIESVNVNGDQVLDIHTGPVSTRQTKGFLNADTGSGDVSIAAHDGVLTVDTGSGAVVLKQCSGEKVTVDTGSGGVRIDDTSCQHLQVDTGSGSVKAQGLEVDAAVIETGSGEVRLHFKRLGAGEFVVDTGSGAIELVLPRDASAKISAETSSGIIRTHLDGIEILKQGKHFIAFTIGGGKARMRLDTTRGSIDIRD